MTKAVLLCAVALSLLTGTASAADKLSDVQMDHVTGGCVADGCCGGAAICNVGSSGLLSPIRVCAGDGSCTGGDVSLPSLGTSGIESVPIAIGLGNRMPLPLTINVSTIFDAALSRINSSP